MSARRRRFDDEAVQDGGLIDATAGDHVISVLTIVAVSVIVASQVAAQDRCVLMMPNSIQAIIAYFALAKLGAVAVPVIRRDCGSG